MAAKSGSKVIQKNVDLKKAAKHQACTPEVGGEPVEVSPAGQGTEFLVLGEARQGVLSPEAIVEVITAELFDRIDSAPWGTRTRIQRKAKVNRNYFNSWKDPSRVRLLPLAHALDLLEVDPAEFFSTAFNQTLSRLEVSAKSPNTISEPGNFFATTATPRPFGVPPLGVQKALERLAAPLSQGKETPPRIQTEEIIDRQELERLDKFRWENPLEANRLLARAIAGSPLELLVEILLLYGATFRQLDRLAAARWAYFVGEKRAKEKSDRRMLATIFHWRSKVEIADGNSSEALDLLRRAAGTFAELGDNNLQAKVVVDIAAHYFYRGMFREAVDCTTIALQNLHENEHWHRFSAHQVRSCGFKGLGDSKAVLSNLEAARALLDHCPKPAAIRFVWLEARMKKEILPLEKAASAFKQATSFFIELGESLDGSLAMLEYARCLIALGKHQDLRPIAEALKGFAFKIDDGSKSGRLSAAALMEVYRAILNGGVSGSLIFSAAKCVRKIAGAPGTPAAGCG